ncbi:MAG: hypothetical protein P1U34_06420 [Coxiellaceae bacterium]|nr:hypothetical protein [Coxiellaceae bacterium]
MRKLMITTLATIAVTGVSTAALADSACEFTKPSNNGQVLGGYAPSKLASLLSAVKAVPSPALKIPSNVMQICQKLSTAALAQGNFAVSSNPQTYANELQSNFCTGQQKTPVPNASGSSSNNTVKDPYPLSPNDVQQLSAYSNQLSQIVSDCNSLTYASSIYGNTMAQAKANNPYPPAVSSQAKTKQQAQPTIKWNTAPKQMPSQSITTDNPNAGNEASPHTPAPFNATPQKGNPNKQYKNTNQGSRFF